MEREPYWNYMGRRLNESIPMDTTLMYQREVFELQKTLQQALIRQKELVEQAYALRRKVSFLCVCRHLKWIYNADIHIL